MKTQKKSALFLLLCTIVMLPALYTLGRYLVYPTYLGWTFENDLQRQPLFMAIQKAHPQEYADFMAHAKQHVHKKDDMNLVATDATRLMDRIFYKHLQHASDEAIASHLKATVDLYRYLYTTDLAMILRFEQGGNTAPVSLDALWKDSTFQSLLQRVLQTKMSIIEAPLPLEGAIAIKAQDAVLNATLAQLAQKFAIHSKTAPEVAASNIIHFYSEIIALGKENAGNIMRHLAAQRELSSHAIHSHST